jgi:uracil permease
MKLSWSKRILFGFQHTLAMFGATVLVPFLTGLDISVALFYCRCRNTAVPCAD